MRRSIKPHSHPIHGHELHSGRLPYFRFMRNLFLGLALLSGLCTTALHAQHSPVGSAARSDSIDLLHTRIELDLTNTVNGLIHGDASITFTPLVGGITKLPLDLLLPVDSVVMDGVQLPFTEADEVVTVDLEGSYGPGDTLTVTVSYGGDPPTDPSGFGGFYTLSSYQYDLGVAFDAVPHSYGRAWFPCFDNFVERCSFDFLVHTTEGRSVYANGALQEVIDLGNGERITHWRLEEPIPSYLASVAAGNYRELTDTFPSVSGTDVPVILAALPQDTAKMRASFIHLQDAFNTFERWFGPYRWNRVGYVLTSAGAMEHATNICYPDFAADGSLGNEDLIAHELSHHWFGNLVTCATPEEMYINEGFADFCAKLFMEDLYGADKYMELTRKTHKRVVATAHLRDQGWYALNNVPPDKTYGETSYRKGSDIARTLRAHMGDSLFSAAMKRFFANNAYSAIGSAAFGDSLSAASGLDLEDFFNNWIFQPGGAAFMVDTFLVQPTGGEFLTEVHVRQKTRGGADFFRHVPVTLTCLGVNGEQFREIVDLDGPYSYVEVSAPFEPVAVRLNDDDRLALSTTWDSVTVSAPGQPNLGEADMRLLVTAVDAPVQVRVEEFWVAADEYPDGTYFVSPDRWWRVEMDDQPGAQIGIRVTVDGRTGLTTAYDQGLVQDVGGVAFHEDSLVLLWRPNPGTAWTVKPVTVNTIGNPTDGHARVEMADLQPGDYALALHALPTAITEFGVRGHRWRYHAGPAPDQLTVEMPGEDAWPGATLLIQDLGGRVLGRHPVRAGQNILDVSRYPNGVVLLSAQFRTGRHLGLGPFPIIH